MSAWIMKEDKMTAQERTDALMQGKVVDHVGLHLFARLYCSYATGLAPNEFYTNVEKNFDAQKWVQEMYGHDETLKYGAATVGAWEFGGDIRMPSSEYDQSPTIIKHPVESAEDVNDLKIPDPKTAGLVPLCMEFSKIQNREGQMTSVLVGSPMLLAANICGDMLPLWMVKDSDLVHHILRMTTDFCISVTKLWVDTFGAENVEPRTATPIESNNMISPKHFEEFGLPYLGELHDSILSMGIKYIYCHICGEQNKNLPLYENISFGNPGIASFGHEVDINDAIKHLGEQCVIVGNVEPARILTESANTVYELSRECIEKGKNAPRGFALGAGCEMAPLAPPVNVWALKKAVNDFGWY